MGEQLVRTADLIFDVREGPVQEFSEKVFENVRSYLFCRHSVSILLGKPLLVFLPERQAPNWLECAQRTVDMLLDSLVPRLCLGTYAFQALALNIGLFHYDSGGGDSRSGVPTQSLGTRRNTCISSRL
jgi:hypothetical protein